MSKWHQRFIAIASMIAMVSSATASAASNSTVEIRNNSSWDIYQLYLSSVDESDWGPDQLRDEVIESGDSYLLHSIPCDQYDVQLVDEDGDVCIVGGVTLCADRDRWTIDDDALLSCQAASE